MVADDDVDAVEAVGEVDDRSGRLGQRAGRGAVVAHRDDRVDVLGSSRLDLGLNGGDESA